MAPTSRRTRTGIQFMGLLKSALDRDKDQALATLSYRLPIVPPGGGLPTTYMVYLTPDKRGTFLATCGEFPSVVTFGQNEEEALTRAELAIRDALEGEPSSSNFPY